jgi:DNA-binding CsgD family transcriptional regulator/tetratricopeptide (TPR) repeat protein
MRLGVIAERQADYPKASAHYCQALALAHSTPNPENQVAWGVQYLSSIDFHQGNLTAAASGFADALARHREYGNPWGVQSCLADLGRVRLAQGDIKEAAARFEEQLALSWDNRIRTAANHALIGLAMVAIEIGRAQEAARLLGAADALRLRTGALLESEAMAEAMQAAEEAHQPLGDEIFAAAFAAGQQLSLEQATQEAYVIAQAAKTGSMSPPADTAGHGLTSREIAVLRLLVEGLSDKEIGEALGISRRTASKHVETILSKLNVPSRTAAATYATRNGLIRT